MTKGLYIHTTSTTQPQLANYQSAYLGVSQAELIDLPINHRQCREKQPMCKAQKLSTQEIGHFSTHLQHLDIFQWNFVFKYGEQAFQVQKQFA